MKACLVLLCSLALAWAPAVWAQNGSDPLRQTAGGIAVSPANLTVDIDSGNAGGAIRVSNLNREPVTFDAQVYHFDLDENNRVRIIAPTPQSLDQWLLINPLRFTVPPGGQQVVRFAVRPRARPEPGEHRAMVYFSPELEPDPDATFNVAVRMGVAIYGVAAPVRRVGSLQAIAATATADTVELALTVASTGNALVRLDGHYGIWPESSYPGDAAAYRSLSGLERNALPEAAVAAGRLLTTPVLPGTERVLIQSLALSLEPGQRYRLAIQGDLQDAPVNGSTGFIAE